MRLYRIMGNAWAGTQADAKAAAKEAGKPWHETEVPTDKPGLLAWLNERNVAARLEELAELAKPPLARDPMDLEDHTGDAGAYLRGPTAGVVISAAEVERVNASRPTFLPRLDAAEIEQRRMAMNRCPKCNGLPPATIDDLARAIVAWVENGCEEPVQDLLEEKLGRAGQ